MARVFHVLVIIILIFHFVIPTNAVTGYVYLEELGGYYRMEGETFRWDESREFVLQDYFFYGNDTIKYVNATLLDNSNNGLFEIVTHQLRDFNFRMKATHLNDGRLANIEWDMILFRNPVNVIDPFTNSERQILTVGDNERYDLRHDIINFTVALEYFEFHEINGELARIRVNTELASDNEPDGRIIRTAVHIIKRDPNGKILFDYNWSIKEVNRLYRILNYFDQPFLAAPFQLGIVFLLIYTYIRLYRYIAEHEINIVKDGQPIFGIKEQEDEISDEETT